MKYTRQMPRHGQMLVSWLKHTNWESGRAQQPSNYSMMCPRERAKTCNSSSSDFESTKSMLLLQPKLKSFIQTWCKLLGLFSWTLGSSASEVPLLQAVLHAKILDAWSGGWRCVQPRLLLGWAHTGCMADSADQQRWHFDASCWAAGARLCPYAPEVSKTMALWSMRTFAIIEALWKWVWMTHQHNLVYGCEWLRRVCRGWRPRSLHASMLSEILTQRRSWRKRRLDSKRCNSATLL